MTAAVKGGGTPPPSERFLSAKEAADYIGVSLKRLYAFCNDGSLRHLRLADTKAGVLRFRRQWLDAWAESRATGGDAPAPTPAATTRRPRRPRPPFNYCLRYWIVTRFPVMPAQRLLATARTLPEALQLAGQQTEAKLVIYDNFGGNHLIVWAGTADAARDSALVAKCATCGHLAVEHQDPFDRQHQTRGCRTIGAECGCQEFRS